LILRRTGIAALVVSISLGMTSNVLFLAAFQFRFDRFFEPTRVVASGATPAELVRWAAVLDLFGYYLATAVLAYVLWRQLRPRNPLIADLSTMAAVGYALAGGVGAAVLAMVAPMLMHNYTDATAAGQPLIAAQFAVVLQVVWRAIWQFLDTILLAAWWLGIGWLLRAIGLGYPAYRWYWQRPRQPGPSPTSRASVWYVMFCSACFSCCGPRGGSRSV
jgi:hypothetical protein